MQQINQAYAVLLSSQFQGFCKDLHAECVDCLLAVIASPSLQATLRYNLLFNRKIDQGNPNPGNIGSDFNRLSLLFWPLVEAHPVRNADRRVALGELNEWRNAIAHQDFAPSMLRGKRPILPLAQVQAWRKACDGLVRSFDDVMRAHIQTMTGANPW